MWKWHGMQATHNAMDLATKILIVDDDKGIRTVVSEFLGKHGYQTATAANPVEMRRMLEAGSYDLIVLDVMMPKEDGLTALRSLGPQAPPVIMLSAVGSDIDRVVGLEMGADDYLAKPCNPRELLARIRAVLRRKAAAQAVLDQAMEIRAGGAEAPPADAAAAEGAPGPSQDQAGATCANGLYFEGWRMDLDMRLLFDPDGRMITLTEGEFRLLLAFAQHPRRVVTRDQLLEWSRGGDADHFDRAIDVQLSRLRRKMTDAGSSGVSELIRTVRNEGYVFVPHVTRTHG
ncbi:MULTISPECIES: response regulator [unclassified Novosphingobium]|uniref:response regulator n=2 Tax=unclassified Novosphingobium TaxID=2644732 RepID=UPI00086AC3B5|nr:MULTISPECIES: response regulator [unclassified Novosphingobium]MDR6705704.1 two-component system OmpR family response regulator [Novosphingobium sp. 1748]ODU79870.1 MAG: DNA-binding response regulator [Novosphingobium sp. SCN 63-17]OJX89037.1 MAG: DNA-binding response regulator [Novosphingobium sp. 63-713]